MDILKKGEKLYPWPTKEELEAAGIPTGTACKHVDFNNNIYPRFAPGEREELELEKKNKGLQQMELFVFDDEKAIPPAVDPKYAHIPVW